MPTLIAFFGSPSKIIPFVCFQRSQQMKQGNSSHNLTFVIQFLKLRDKEEEDQLCANLKFLLVTYQTNLMKVQWTNKWSTNLALDLQRMQIFKLVTPFLAMLRKYKYHITMLYVYLCI